MTMLNEKILDMEYDNLIYSVNPPAEVFAVKIRKGTEAAILKRGTVLALSAGKSGDGTCVILGTEASENETLAANCILADDTEIDTAEDVNAIAYRTGHFNENRLITADEYEFSAADKEALRHVGILISEAMKY